VLDICQVRCALNRASTTIAQSSFLFDEIADRLIERLSMIRLQPNRILECGAQTGYLSQQLKQYYPKSDIIVVDYADQMLSQIAVDDIFKSTGHYAALPFNKQTFDMVISSLALDRTNDLATVFRECRRVLKTNGLLIFSMCGVETLKELRGSFIDCKEYLHRFPDMHDVGDLLLQSGFENPVMEMEKIVIRYKKLATFFKDLKNTGTGNVHQKKPSGLFGKNRWQHALKRYETLKVDNAYPVTFEIIYGHAWLPEITTEQTAKEIFVSSSISQL